jgi:predicted RNA polymerase sigma factor
VRAVYRVLDELPVADRLAFTLHHIEGEKLEVVARLCRCSPATAKRRIARAQHAIEERMGDGPMSDPRDLLQRIARVGAEIDPALTDRDVERLVTGARARGAAAATGARLC